MDYLYSVGVDWGTPPVTSLLAIDPGAKTGWAWYYLLDGGTWWLWGAGVGAPPQKTPYFVVIENPQIYPHSKARPNDILKLARIVGRYEERYHDSEAHLVTPHEWKGSIPGDIMCARTEGALTPDERTITDRIRAGVRHNALDAIGLAKWAIRQPWVKKAVAAV